jgi:hypothetical protein
MAHKHKAEQSKDVGWTACVTPDECATHPYPRQDAHGNITRVDTCSCGAIRKSEINGGRTNYGPWEDLGPAIEAEAVKEQLTKAQAEAQVDTILRVALDRAKVVSQMRQALLAGNEAEALRLARIVCNVIPKKQKRDDV